MAAQDDKKKRVVRPFPKHSIEEALQVAQKIQDERGGKPFNRLLLAESLGIKPSSSDFRDLLSSSYKYGLSDRTEKASDISLTQLGSEAIQTKDIQKRITAIRTAIQIPEIFKKVLNDYNNKKVPTSEMLPKILVASYRVPDEFSVECSKLIIENGKFAKIIRDIGGSAHILIDNVPSDQAGIEDTTHDSDDERTETEQEQVLNIPNQPESSESNNEKPKPIFIGHGKNKAPLQKLQTILTSFQIPHKVTIEEANLGRPIPQKVKETLSLCGSAILIFTKDEKLFDESGNEIWRPSENVVHELGASSFLFGDRIVIFKEKGLSFPTNFQSIGYIEFEVDSIEAKTTDLLKELIGFGLIKITPA